MCKLRRIEYLRFVVGMYNNSLFIYLFYFFIHIVAYAIQDLPNYVLKNYNTCTEFQTVIIIK